MLKVFSYCWVRVMRRLNTHADNGCGSGLLLTKNAISCVGAAVDFCDRALWPANTTGWPASECSRMALSRGFDPATAPRGGQLLTTCLAERLDVPTLGANMGCHILNQT